MVRGLLLATSLLLVSQVIVGQSLGALHIKVVVLDDDQHEVPVPRHVLFISDNPATAPPRRVVTGADGTVEVRLRPGSYTVESDRPVAILGRGYQWAAIVQMPAGEDAALELSNSNAEIVSVTPAMASLDAGPEPGASLIVPRWNTSLVGLWTPTEHGTGFIVDERGFIATSSKVVRDASSVEVQITPTIKVEGRVLVADATRDVSVVWVAPTATSAASPVLLGCRPPTPPPAVGQDLVALGVSFAGTADATTGTVGRLSSGETAWNLDVPAGSVGGPVFTADGSVVGLASADDRSIRPRSDARVVPMAAVCDAMALATDRAGTTAPPGAARLPVEPKARFSPAALKAGFDHHGANLSPYRMSSSDFDVAFITPLMVYAARQAEERTAGTEMPSKIDQMRVPRWSDFGSWSDYVEAHPSVLLVRVTPKLAESFWTTMARGAAMTQGMQVPALKRFKPPLARLRLLCGDSEVAPIHPFALESQVVERETVTEGLYVFAPESIGPSCGTVKLRLSSEKDPNRADTRVVDPVVVRQLWQDFEPLRTQ